MSIIFLLKEWEVTDYDYWGSIKKVQNQLGLTATAMAAGIISKGTYSKVVNGKQSLSSDSLVKILFKNNIDI
ncbi:helix-turn-helix domain-containing protein, partial [Lactobacillus crispatus]